MADEAKHLQGYELAEPCWNPIVVFQPHSTVSIANVLLSRPSGNAPDALRCAQRASVHVLHGVQHTPGTYINPCSTPRMY